MHFLNRSLLLCLVIPTYAHTAEKMDYLEEMQLEQLLQLDVKVVSASKKEESIATAPAIVSVFSRQDIADTGVSNIVEALSIMTGVFSYDTYFSQYNLISFRNNFGGEHYLSKILFLVNGHPIYNPIQGGVKLNALPIEAVERIEVVRGPVSVLYGTNALTGVINIITRNDSDVRGAAVSAHAGSHSTKEMNITGGQEIEDFSYLISGTVHSTDGYDFDIEPEQDEAGNGVDTRQYGEEYNSLFANLVYKGFSLDISYLDTEKAHKFGIIPNSAFTGADTFDDTLFYIDLRYEHPIGDSITMHYKLRYDDMESDWRNNGIYLLESGPFGLSSDPHITDVHNASSKTGGEIYANINFTENWDLNTGVAYDKYKTEPYQFDIDKSVVASGFSPLSSWETDIEDNDVAFYANTNLKLLTSLSLVAGLRHTDNDTSGTQNNYRAGIIYELSEHFTIKGLYATSYRSGNFFERNVDSAPILQGDSDIKNEELKGFDLALYYKSNKTTASINYYQNKTEDFIKRQAINNVPTYTNLKGEKTTGLEFEVKHNMSVQWSGFLNGTYSLDTENLSTGDELDYIIERMANIGISYKPFRFFTTSLYGSYRSEWAESDAFSLVNYSVSYSPNLSSGQLKLSLHVNNLLDKEYTYAEVSRQTVETIPGGTPRTVMLGLGYHF